RHHRCRILALRFRRPGGAALRRTVRRERERRKLSAAGTVLRLSPPIRRRADALPRRLLTASVVLRRGVPPAAGVPAPVPLRTGAAAVDRTADAPAVPHLRAAAQSGIAVRRCRSAVRAARARRRRHGAPAERRLRSAGAEVRRYHRTEPMTDTEGTHARPEVLSHGLRRRDDSPVVGDRSVGPRQRLHGTECDLTRGRRDSRRLRRVRRARARAHVTWRSAEPTTAERATHRAPTQPDTRLVDLADPDRCAGAPI